MNRIGLIAALWLGCVGGASAQDVLVRTAEHDGFTRIVVDFKGQTTWRTDAGPADIALRTEAPISYDLGDIYRRIRRDRIQSITPDDNGGLKINLACDCDFNSFQLPGGGVVIDVAGDPSTKPKAAGPWKDGVIQSVSLPPAPAILPGLLRDALDPGPDATSRRAAVTSARLAISEQFARGAAQGLVDADLPAPIVEAPRPVVAKPAPAAAPLANTDTPFPNMRVETQLDRDSPAFQSIARQRGCIPAETSDLGSWATEDRAWEQAQSLTANLYSSAGDPDPAAHAALARTFLFMTFGVEAGRALHNANLDMPEKSLLPEMADVMDGGPGGPVLASQLACDSVAALLAVLNPVAPTLQDPSHVLRRFADLPRTLRGYLGPRLAERLLDMGLREAAMTARNAYEHAGPSSAMDTGFVSAKMDAQRSGADLQNDLLPVVENRLPRAAEAMTFLIASMTGRGEPVPPNLLDQGRALSFEAVDPERAGLERAILKARLADGDLLGTLEELTALEDRSRGPFDDLRQDIFRGISVIEEDDAFLTTIVPLSGQAISDPDVRLKISERLLSLSLVTQAEAVIDASPDIPTRPERILRARIAADSGKADIAETYLAGLEGDDIERVRQGFPLPEAAEPIPLPSAPAPIAVDRREFEESELTLANSASLRKELDALLSE